MSSYRPESGAVLLLIALLAVGCGVPGEAPAVPEPIQNLLFIMGDDHSTGVFGAYGNALIRTPGLDRLAAQGAGQAGPADLRVDGALAPGGATVELVEQLEAAGPFGQANPAPRLAFGSAQVTGVRIVGNGHCQLRLVGSGGPQLAAIAFRAADSGLAALFEAAALSRTPLHLAGRMEIDDWGGRRKPKLTVEDASEVV